MARFVEHSRFLQIVRVSLALLLSFGMLFNIEVASAKPYDRGEESIRGDVPANYALSTTSGEGVSAQVSPQAAKTKNESPSSPKSDDSKRGGGNSEPPSRSGDDSKGSGQEESESGEDKRGGSDSDDSKKDDRREDSQDDEPENPPRPVDQGADLHQDILSVTGYIPNSQSGEVSGDVYFEYKRHFGPSGFFRNNKLYRENETYRMYSAKNGWVDIIGEGVTLANLLVEFHGGSLDTIDEVEFISHDGALSKTIAWDVISSGGEGPLIAVNSYVIAADSSSDDEPELLENTRYRILFNDDAASVNADDLCNINEIVINPNFDPPDEPEQYDYSPFVVSLDYTPAPIGQEARLVCVFKDASGDVLTNKDLEDYELSYTWRESSDGGSSWHDYSQGTDKELAFIVDEDNQDHLFMVRVSVKPTDDSTGFKDVESSPVKVGGDSKQEGRGAPSNEGNPSIEDAPPAASGSFGETALTQRLSENGNGERAASNSQSQKADEEPVEEVAAQQNRNQQSEEKPLFKEVQVVRQKVDRDLLRDNPFAPIVIFLTLGSVVAGTLMTSLSFRRQLR